MAFVVVAIAKVYTQIPKASPRDYKKQEKDSMHCKKNKSMTRKSHALWVLLK